MSQLAVLFKERLSFRHPQRRLSVASDATVSSSAANEFVKENDCESREGQNPREQLNRINGLKPEMNIFIKDSKNLKIGDRITHIYNTCFSEDCKNPAFILNNKNLDFTQKFKYVLGLPSCWGLMFLIMIICTFINTMLFMIIASPSIVQTRNDWGARPPLRPIDAQNLPTNRIIVTQTDELESCFPMSECRERVRNLQEKYQNMNMSDIPFNFLIGDDGFVYEGRGIHFQGKMARNPSQSSFGGLGLIVAFFGSFEDTEPSETQINVFARFLVQLTKSEVLSGDTTIFLEQHLTLAPVPNGLLNSLRNEELIIEFYELQAINPRITWGAEDPKDPNLSVRFTDMAVGSRARGIEPPCATLDECIERLQSTQTNDMVLYNDILYNFMISEFGVFEGRGWDIKTDSNVVIDRDFILVGILEEELEPVKDMYFKLYADGVMLGKIKADENFGNRECECGICPHVCPV